MVIKMESLSSPEFKNGILDEKFQDSVSSSSSSSIATDSSDQSDLFDQEVNSNSSDNQHPIGPLHEMSSLLQHLPIKRGLSEHYNGKSQSFTCLSNVKCLEDLAKPESPYNKKLKSCKSDGGLILEGYSYQCKKEPRRNSIILASRVSTKRTARGAACVGRNNARPPLPHRSATRSRFSSPNSYVCLIN